MALVALVAVVAIPTVAALWLAAGDERLLILAPSSLAPLQAELDAELVAAGIDEPEWVFAGSQALVAQLIDGAPADVLITADRTTFDIAAGAGVTWDDGTPLARNHLVVAVPSGNPAAVALTDPLAALDDDRFVLGICAVAVPCGGLTSEAERALGIDLQPDTEETSVRALTTKIAAGELDLGLVYVTDLLAGLAAGQLDGVVVDELTPFTTAYWATASSRGDDIVDVLAGSAGQAVFADAGFLAP